MKQAGNAVDKTGGQMKLTQETLPLRRAVILMKFFFFLILHGTRLVTEKVILLERD